MMYDVIQSLVVLIEKLPFFNKQLQGIYCIIKLLPILFNKLSEQGITLQVKHIIKNSYIIKRTFKIKNEQVKLVNLLATLNIYLSVKEILKALIQNNFYQILENFQGKYLWRNLVHCNFTYGSKTYDFMKICYDSMRIYLYL